MAGNYGRTDQSVADRVFCGKAQPLLGIRAPAPSSPPCPRFRVEASLKVASRAAVLSHLHPKIGPLIYGEDPPEAIKRLVLARSYAKVRVLLADRRQAWSTTNRFLAIGAPSAELIDLRCH